MSDIEKVLKDVVYGSVGAVAAAIEAGGDLARTFVEKGQEAVRQGQERAEEMKQAVHDAYIRDFHAELTKLTRAERDEVRRMLDELDAAEEAAMDAAVAEEETSDEEACATNDTECEKPAGEEDTDAVAGEE